MRLRSIDNYLSQEEMDLINAFLQDSIYRFENYDGRIRMAPKRLKTDDLQKLYIAKYGRWEKAVRTQIQDSSSTYLNLLRESVLTPCPIERFLKVLMKIIEQAIPPGKHRNMLQKLEVELDKCEFSCPCPAEQ